MLHGVEILTNQWKSRLETKNYGFYIPHFSHHLSPSLGGPGQVISENTNQLLSRHGMIDSRGAFRSINAYFLGRISIKMNLFLNFFEIYSEYIRNIKI